MMGVVSERAAIISIAAMGALFAVPAAAQVGIGVTENVVSRYDPSQRYAVFVPASYDPALRWPLLLVMDPRGRALLPLEMLRPSAEELGYVVLSSYNTRSDEDATPNRLAVAAMIEDAQNLFKIDTRRLYFMGMSGTARESWAFGEQFAANTAGIIGFAASLPGPGELVALTLDGSPPFPFFGGAGDVDYNQEEMRELDAKLDEYGFDHYIDFYSGPHGWPDASVFAHALEWMEIQAVREGTVARSAVDIDALYQRAVERATELEESGDVEAAWRLWHSMESSYDGLVDTEVAVQHSSALEESRELRRERQRIQREITERKAFDAEVIAVLQEVRERDRPLNVSRTARRLGLPRLVQTRSEDDGPAGRAAARKLASVFVLASFYLPREFEQRGRHDIANSFLRLAATIEEDDPTVLLGLSRTHAQLGEIPQALDALERAVEIGAIGTWELEQDSLLAPLRGEPRFDAMAKRRVP